MSVCLSVCLSSGGCYCLFTIDYLFFVHYHWNNYSFNCSLIVSSKYLYTGPCLQDREGRGREREGRRGLVGPVYSKIVSHSGS